MRDIELPFNLCPVGVEGAESVNKIAASSRVGEMPEESPNLSLAFEPQQRNGSIGLVLRQSILDLFRYKLPVPDRRS
jgi:hypothetical protein